MSGNMKILTPNLVLESARRLCFRRKSAEGGRNSIRVSAECTGNFFFREDFKVAFGDI